MIPHTLKSKQGFGILEVVIAAVVLGFMLIGVNSLQKGNREGILRVRVRDAASNIAQSTIDSITALGSAMVLPGNCFIPKKESPCGNMESACNAASTAIQSELLRHQTKFFEGRVGEVKTDYCVVIDVKKTEDEQKVVNSTAYTRSSSTLDDFLDQKLAKHIEVTVSWKFKNSDQSINVSTVIR